MIVPKLLSSFFLFVFWPLHLACRILDPDQWLNPGPMTGRVLCPNHYTARELPSSLLFAWPRKTFSVVQQMPDCVLEFQRALHLGSQGVVWTWLEPVLDKQQKEEEWVMGTHGRNGQLHLLEVFQRPGPQSLCGLGPICRYIAFDAGKVPDKLRTLTSFPKSRWAEGKWADTLTSDSKTSLSCRIFWRVWFQSKEFWAYTLLIPTMLHEEIKKKNLISFRAVGIWTQWWRSTDLMFVLAGKSVFLEDTH